jgi:hypothetical protein
VISIHRFRYGPLLLLFYAFSILPYFLAFLIVFIVLDFVICHLFVFPHIAFVIVLAFPAKRLVLTHLGLYTLQKLPHLGFDTFRKVHQAQTATICHTPVLYEVEGVLSTAAVTSSKRQYSVI